MVKHLGFFVFLIGIVIFSSSKHVECGVLKRVHRKGYGRLATVGVICKCCDGEGGECRSSWDASYSCTKLQCLPWKYL
ncbi:hypothetical protein GQ457_18G008660 [Hibiscus cannabinus]